MTVHSAKGLEWDTVFIPGVTRFDWPGVICSRCESAGMCSRSAYGYRIVDAKKMPDGLIEEMGLLYVGVTRARKAVHVSASMQRRTKCGNYQVACPSCLTSLPGIEPVSWAVMEGGDLWRYGVCLLLARGSGGGSGRTSPVVKRTFSAKYSDSGLRKVRLSGRLPTRKLLDRHIFCYQYQSNGQRLLQETCR